MAQGGIAVAKEGIPSFLLDCRTNDNISEIEAEYGVKGFAVVVRLWQKIYAEKGYYCEWIERSPLLFLSNWFGGNSGVTVSLINEIVKRCLNNGIFDAKMHEDYSILTSARIQMQYFDAAKRRKEILVKKQYLLVSVDKIEGIAYENDVSVCRNRKNVCRNDTREGKVREGKVNKINTGVPRRYYPDELLNQAFIDYLEMRKKIKKPMTDRAIELAMKKLKELSTLPFSDNMDNDTAIKILEQSVMNCWQGLFPLKRDKQKTGNSDWEQKWRDA